MTSSQVHPDIRAARAHQTAEIFTPDHLVNQMLNKLPKSVWHRGKTFLDPAVGNGQFLIHILWRKISRGHDPLAALSTLYGADIMRDNIRECRLRLLKIVSLFTPVTEQHISVVMKQIVWIDIKKHPTGSLEYNFEFKNSPKKADIARWLKYIEKDKILDDVELPVSDEQFERSGNTVDLFAEFDEEQ